MPARPYPRLAAREVKLIKLWIESGAKNTSHCASCDTLNFRYSERIAPLMTSWCVGCHNGPGAGGNIDLTTYSGVVAAIANNRLLGSVRHEAGFIAMPQNGGTLPDCDIAAIEKWVNAGHLEN
jgi:hypothetical protein